jgi:hypothetical protein
LSAILLQRDIWAEQHPGLPVQLQIQVSTQLDLNFQGREVVPREILREGDAVG